MESIPDTAKVAKNLRLDRPWVLGKANNCTSPMDVSPISVSSYECHSHYVSVLIFGHPLSPPGSYTPSANSFPAFLNPKGQHLMEIYHLGLNFPLSVHVSVFIPWTAEGSISSKAGSRTIYGYRYKHLEGSLATWPLRKTSVCCPFWHMISLEIDFDHVYSIRHEFPLVEETSDQIIPLCTSRHNLPEDQFCST